jgi:hypothetical protein
VPRSIARVVRRGDTFYFRMAVPRQLAARLGKRELKVSLRTCSPGAARAARHKPNIQTWVVIARATRPNVSRERVEIVPSASPLLPQRTGHGRAFRVSDVIT